MPSSGHKSARNRCAPWKAGDEDLALAPRSAPDRAHTVGSRGAHAQPHPLRRSLAAGRRSRACPRHTRSPSPAWPRVAHRERDRGGLRAGGRGRALGRLSPGPAANRGAHLRAAPRHALRRPERGLVSLAHALLRPRSRFQDRFRILPGLLPRDPRRARGHPPGAGHPRHGGGVDGGQAVDDLPQGDAARHGFDHGRRPAHGARAGFGYVINYAYGLMMTAEYAALVVLVAAAVLLLDGAGALIEARVKQWAG